MSGPECRGFGIGEIGLMRWRRVSVVLRRTGLAMVSRADVELVFC